MAIYFYTPDITHPAGGIRITYRFVDALNGAGIDAAVLHQRPGFKAGWFKHRTRVVAAPETIVDSRDVLVLSELDAARVLSRVPPSIPKVILNQAHYLTFVGPSVDYRRADVVAVLAVSADGCRYLSFAFPGLKPERVHLAVDPALFHSDEIQNREKTIGFLPTKGAHRRIQITRIIEQRQTLHRDGWTLTPLTGMSHEALAVRLRQISIVAGFSEEEGFQLFLTEAMASGCAVVGFDGGGGREFLTEDVSWPVPAGDPIAFAQRLEEAAAAPGAEVASRTDAARELVRRRYTPEAEATDVVRILSPIALRASANDGQDTCRVPALPQRSRAIVRRARNIARAALDR